MIEAVRHTFNHYEYTDISRQLSSVSFALGIRFSAGREPKAVQSTFHNSLLWAYTQRAFYPIENFITSKLWGAGLSTYDPESRTYLYSTGNNEEHFFNIALAWINDRNPHLSLDDDMLALFPYKISRKELSVDKDIETLITEQIFTMGCASWIGRRAIKSQTLLQNRRHFTTNFEEVRYLSMYMQNCLNILLANDPKSKEFRKAAQSYAKNHRKLYLYLQQGLIDVGASFCDYFMSSHEGLTAEKLEYIITNPPSKFDHLENPNTYITG